MIRSKLVLGALALLVLPACEDPGQTLADSLREGDRSIRDRMGPPDEVRVDPQAPLALSAAFRSAAEEALPAVVFITVEQRLTQAAHAAQVPEPFRRFFDMPDEAAPPPVQRGTGSGFIIDPRGYIVTNNHVVANASLVVVEMLNGREYEAQVVGTDAATDLAVLRITAENGESFPAVDLGRSEDVRVGDWVLALGNPLGLDFTVTAGIVSAKGRAGITSGEIAVESFIQTDAAINPGNSGGPLIDLEGRVVGVNTAIFGGRSFIGYGFAVPVDLARKAVADLVEHGYVRRPMLGAVVGDVQAADAEVLGLDQVAGAHIASIEAGGPADRAGLQPDDVVTAIDDTPVSSGSDFIRLLALRQPGEEVELTVLREGETRATEVQLGAFPRAERSARAPAARRDAQNVLGVRVAPLTAELARRAEVPVDRGVIVTEVSRTGSAAMAGVRPGQVLLRIDGQPVETPEDVRRIVAGLEPGQAVGLRLLDPQRGETAINLRIRR